MKTTKADLITMIKEEYPRASLAQIWTVVTVLTEVISDKIAAGEKIEIRGFGKFSSKIRPGYTGRNPQTGESVQIPACKNPRLKFSLGFLNKVRL